MSGNAGSSPIDSAARSRAVFEFSFCVMSEIEAIPACEPHFNETTPYLVVNNIYIYISGAMIGPSSHVPNPTSQVVSQKRTQKIGC